MPIPLQNGVTVTRLRGTQSTNQYGNDEIDWTNPAKLVINGCALAPLVEDEQNQAGQSGVIKAWTLYAPWVDIVHTDRVDTPHGLFEVDGEPGYWRSPYTGRKPGMTVRLRRVTS